MLKITDTITSRSNQRIKNLLELQKRHKREKQEMFVIEGIREIQKAVHSGYHFESVFFLPELLNYDRLTSLFGKSLPSQIFQINSDVYNKIAYRESSGGVVAISEPKFYTLENLEGRLSSNPMLLVIEGVEKPGNLGAIYRSADAAGLDGIIICNQATDIYNPNAIRASLGCVFTVPTAVASVKMAIKWLSDKDIRLYTTYLKEAVPYYSVDFNKPLAVIMGAESTGISDEWLDAGTTNILIPMLGVADSLNVSTSAAVIVFEALRQRSLK